MSDLVRINSNQVVTDSRSVAEHFGKEHKNVLRAIDDLVAQNSATKNMFYETSHEYRGQSFRYFLMNRDGFSLLVMGFTGKTALGWKIKYINAFNEMEKALKDQRVKQVEQDKAKEMRAEAMLKNADSRRAKLLLEIAAASHIDGYKEMIMTKTANMLAGEPFLPMPKSGRERHDLGWYCERIGKGKNWASPLGKILKKNGIKKEQGVNGEYAEDHARGDIHKQVQNFEWYADFMFPQLRALGFDAVKE
ncbi:Rha family transcriptional regulator [Selenomonas bovis]|uniref:Rha family transcriptional regulator n=1 Tax=Selenomonas bovis TaxID=416586 RepID=UPI003AB9298D